MAHSNLVLKFSDCSTKKIFKEILFYHENVRCVYLLESPHRGDSNEYTQHTSIVQKIEKTSPNYHKLLPDQAPWLTLSDFKYLCLEQFSIVQKMFEPLRFDCRYCIKCLNVVVRTLRWWWWWWWWWLMMMIWPFNKIHPANLKYSDSLTLYRTYPELWTSIFYYLLMSLNNDVWVANSVYPDQTPQHAASDLVLHCLLGPVRPNT